MTDVKSNKMLARFGLMYGAPSKDPHEGKAIVNEYARLMGQYSDAELDGAADRLIKTRKFKNWPTIAECITALEDYRAEAHAKSVPVRRAHDPYPDWSNEAIAEADKMIVSDMGRQAACEGWILGLHDYCRKHRKLPSQYEIGAMMESAKFTDRIAAGVFPTPPDAGRRHFSGLNIATTGALKRLGNTLLARREKLARLALGE